MRVLAATILCSVFLVGSALCDAGAVSECRYTPSADSAVCRALDTDCVAKWLVGGAQRTGGAGPAQRINVDLLYTNICDSIRIGRARDLVFRDLAGGDQRLREIIWNHIVLSSRRPRDAEESISKWASGRNLEKLDLELARLSRMPPKVVRPLTEYFLSRSDGSEDSWRRDVWARVTRQIEGDGGLTLERDDRVRTGTPVYSRISDLLRRALASQSEWWSLGWFPIARRQGGRSALILDACWHEVCTQHGRVGESKLPLTMDSMEISAEKSELLRTTMVNFVERDAAWKDYVLWYLTRPAEALVAVIRQALAESVGLNATEFHLLAADDGYWTHTVEKSQTETASREILRSALRRTLERDPVVRSAWVQTLRQNHPRLKAEFVRRSSTSHLWSNVQAFDQWLNGIQFRSSPDGILPITEVSDFQTMVLDLIDDPSGWLAIVDCLTEESTDIPFHLRDALIAAAVGDINAFWSLWRVISASPDSGLDEVRQRVAIAIHDSQIADRILEALLSPRTQLKEAIIEEWVHKVWTKTPSVFSAAMKQVRSGSTQDLIAPITLSAFVRLIECNQCWPQIASLLSKDIVTAPQRARPGFLKLAGKQSRLFWRSVEPALEDVEIRSAWREEIEEECVRGRSKTAWYSWVKRNRDIHAAWRAVVEDSLITNPEVLQAVCAEEASLPTVVGNRTMTQTTINQAIVSSVLGSRVLFERVIDDRTTGMRSVSMIQ